MPLPGNPHALDPSADTPYKKSTGLPGSFSNTGTVQQNIDANSVDDPGRRNVLKRIGGSIATLFLGTTMYSVVTNEGDNEEMENTKIDLDSFRQYKNQMNMLHTLDRNKVQIQSTGKLARPLEGKYKINSVYGYRKSEKKDHNGRDINTPIDTPVYSPADGTVVISARESKYSGVVNNIANFFGQDASKGYGNYIVISHGDGLYTLYAHLDQRKVKAGDRVQQGDLIAQTGDTGSGGAHLHFEIRKGSNSRTRSVSPASFFDIIVTQ